MCCRIVLIWLLALAAPAFAAESAWWEASTENFRVYSDGNEHELIEFAKRVEMFDQVLRVNTNVKPRHFGPRVHIVVQRNAPQVQRLLWKPGSDIAGFYYNGLRGARAVIHRGKPQNIWGLTGEAILFHEYAHHFMLQHAAVAYPRWYVEGFAEYYSSVEFKKNGDVNVGTFVISRFPSLELTEWLKSERLFELNYSERRAETEMLYAQGWLLTHYIGADAARSQQFGDYLTRINRGDDNIRAFEQAFGLTMRDLDKELRKHYRQLKTKGIAYRRFSVDKFRTPEVKLRRLTRGEAAALPIDIRLRGYHAHESHAALLSEVAKLREELPNDVHVLTIAAEVELACDRFSDARATAERVLQLDPNNSRAFAVKGASFLGESTTAHALTANEIKAARGLCPR